jgi:glycosyltransferase involved in cell wall biosynthesis
MLSIIIPAKNEEGTIDRLLKSIKRQSFKDYEIIVADAHSTDKTAAIAKRSGARVVNGGMPGPGRNRGAEVAKGCNLLFLDADVILPKDFLKKNYRDFLNRNLDVATTFVSPLSRKLIDKIIFKNINIGYRLIEKIKPGAQGFHIFAKKKWFDKVKGFDEKAYFCEDYDFVLKIWKKGGRFGILEGPAIKVSVRRLDKEGRVKYLAKCLYGIVHQQVKGPLYRDVTHYEFAEYDKKKPGKKHTIRKLKSRIKKKIKKDIGRIKDRL